MPEDEELNTQQHEKLVGPLKYADATCIFVVERMNILLVNIASHNSISNISTNNIDGLPEGRTRPCWPSMINETAIYNQTDGNSRQCSHSVGWATGRVSTASGLQKKDGLWFAGSDDFTEALHIYSSSCHHHLHQR